jgi:hypothetical protein
MRRTRSAPRADQFAGIRSRAPDRRRPPLVHPHIRLLVHT